ncbi:MAG: hypothetical protein L6R40_008387 [Gallowayella cf. fulva]|nr:MAG: hypothetical protein L6R40_008387 [Xanthomendoza cf. fulva]
MGHVSIPLNIALVGLWVILSQWSDVSLPSLKTWVGILTSINLIYCCWIYPFYLSPLRRIPTVPGNPLWGHIFTLFREEAAVPHRAWHQKYGNLVRFFLPFGLEIISVADDGALKSITATHPYNFPYPPIIGRELGKILGKRGLLTTQGETHTLQRKMMALGFSINSIGSLSPIFWEKALSLADIWRQETFSRGEGGKTVDVFEWSTRVTLDIICEGGFGVNIDSLRNPKAPLHKAYRLAFSTDYNILQDLRKIFGLLSYLPLRVNSDAVHSRQIIKEEAAQIADHQHESNPSVPGNKDIMSLVIKTNKRLTVPDDRITAETLEDHVRTFLGAGHDTTATATAWSLLLLAKHPNIQTKLRNEILEHMPFLSSPENARPEDLPDPDHLPYLDSVTRECLRFMPPVPFTLRQSCVPTHLASHPIPPGTFIFVPIHAINRLPSYWGPDADVFNPERWSNLPPEWTNNAYMTFSQGPKGCIGRKFAETELKILLCCLVARFDFGVDEMMGKAADRKMWRLVHRPKWGVKLKVALI